MLAEIASSPAGQTDDAGPPDGPDLRVGHSELQVPTPGRASLLSTPGESPPDGCSLGTLGGAGLSPILDRAGHWAVPVEPWGSAKGEGR